MARIEGIDAIEEKELGLLVLWRVDKLKVRRAAAGVNVIHRQGCARERRPGLIGLCQNKLAHMPPR